ncbi:MAG TPA: thiosulfohydrolase SoxB [Burkholderiales bacterium]|nr:thiosulfohydrolase SoxB [Burkholderiales bacterium]
MLRREFLRVLAAAAAAGASLRPGASDAQAADELYEAPAFGNVSLLHITDVHAQLLPTWFREPSVNIGNGQPPHLVGLSFLEKYSFERQSRQAYAFTHLDFPALARRYGATGGYAHLATLVKRLRASRPHALLLDGGDSWQGSATALWTQGADMIGAQKRLGVDYATGHWEFTYGEERVKQALAEAAPIQFLAQNVRTADFEEEVFAPYALRTVNGVPLAVIGQAFPYTPIAHPRRFVADWTFGIRESQLQKRIDEVRAKGARAVVLLSHNGADVDLKLASRVRGLDVILGGHTHDALPAPVQVGQTLVTNAGCNGKFVGVLDLQVGKPGVSAHRYKLLPVFSNLLPADAAMSEYIESVRRPYKEKLEQKLAVTEGLLYRRGNFNGSTDQLIVDALMDEKDVEIAFSPGFRWGTALLPGETLTMERLLDQTAITYPQVTASEMTGEALKSVLEDICDNLFNPDPYYQQGGDMVRVGGMTYTCRPNAPMGSRIVDMRVRGRRVEAGRRYKVAGWAPVGEAPEAEPVWDLVARWLRSKKRIAPRVLNRPRVEGVAGNRGIA